MSDRYWYQDGGTLFLILFFGALFGWIGYDAYQDHLRDSLPYVVPEVAGRLNIPFFGPPTLEITVYHQHPAALRNVILQVNVNEDPARREEHWDRRKHSLESWSPNQDHGVTFSFPLKHYAPQKEIHIGLILTGPTIKPFVTGEEWLGTTWKANL